MAEVADYIAKRAETNTVINETLAGLGILDSVGGVSTGNVISVGVDEYLKKSVGTAAYAMHVTLKLVNGGLVSGLVNVIQEPENGNQWRAFVTGAVGGTGGAVFASGVMGGTAAQALAVFLAESTVASGVALAGVGLVSAGVNNHLNM